MIKKFCFIIALIFSFILPCFAQKIPVRISPTQVISTHHDEVEAGDYINFIIVKDLYVQDKLYLEKNTPVIGHVGFLHNNGWAGDNAEIKINLFETVDTEGKKVIINYPLVLKGNSMKANDVKQWLADFFTYFIRGSEIYIEPDTKVFNIFIEQ